MRRNTSILDSVTEGSPAPSERPRSRRTARRLGEYLENIREIERRIQKAEQQARQKADAPAAPSGCPESLRRTRRRCIFDLLAVAFQADLTRVASFMIGRDVTYHNYPELGFTGRASPAVASRQQSGEDSQVREGERVRDRPCSRKFLEKLSATPDGDGSLLDHAVVLYGSGMSRGNQHSHTGLPVLVAGGGAGQIKGDRHLKNPVSAADGIPNGNVLLTIAQKFGFELDRFGQSNGTIDL